MASPLGQVRLEEIITKRPEASIPARSIFGLAPQSVQYMNLHKHTTHNVWVRWSVQFYQLFAPKPHNPIGPVISKATFLAVAFNQKLLHLGRNGRIQIASQWVYLYTTVIKFSSLTPDLQYKSRKQRCLISVKDQCDMPPIYTKCFTLHCLLGIDNKRHYMVRDITEAIHNKSCLSITQGNNWTYVKKRRTFSLGVRILWLKTMSVLVVRKKSLNSTAV